MLVDIMNEQIKDNDVVLLVVNDSYSSSLLNKLDSRIEVKLFNRKRGSRSPLPFIRLNYYIWRQNPDAVHLHSYSLASTIKISKKKLYLTVHALNYDDRYFNKFHKLFAISNAVATDIQNKGDYNVKLIPNGVDVSKIKTKSNHYFGEAFKIVQVANLISTIKGQDILLKALSLIVHQYHISNITVDFIGQGDSLPELEKLATELGVEKNVNFLGYRDRDYIYSHLCDYEMMCHPSRFEGFGLVVAEGMAARLPVLVATGDGPYEIINKGQYGYCFDRENEEDCAAKIVDIYQNYQTRSLIAESACQHVLDEYSVQKTAQEYLNEYK